MAKSLIDVEDQAVKAGLNSLISRLDNPSPVLKAIGEDLVARAKECFSTSTGPDGQRWAPNAQSTLMAYLAKRGGFGKRGINKKGMALAMSKKPLIGITGDLAREIHYTVTGNTLTVGSTMVYAAMQQFGGKKSQFPHLWGDIPARPFLPVRSDGTLYPDEQSKILAAINEFLAGD